MYPGCLLTSFFLLGTYYIYSYIFSTFFIYKEGRINHYLIIDHRLKENLCRLIFDHLMKSPSQRILNHASDRLVYIISKVLRIYNWIVKKNFLRNIFFIELRKNSNTVKLRKHYWIFGNDRVCTPRLLERAIPRNKSQVGVLLLAKELALGFLLLCGTFVKFSVFVHYRTNFKETCVQSTAWRTSLDWCFKAESTHETSRNSDQVTKLLG